MHEVDPRFMSAVAVIDTLNTENRKLRDELNAATVAAQAASTFYWAEWAGEKTYLTPAQVKDRFADAMVEYREATGADQPDLNHEHEWWEDFAGNRACVICLADADA